MSLYTVTHAHATVTHSVQHIQHVLLTKVLCVPHSANHSASYSAQVSTKGACTAHAAKLSCSHKYHHVQQHVHIKVLNIISIYVTRQRGISTMHCYSVAHAYISGEATHTSNTVQQF